VKEITMSNTKDYRDKRSGPEFRLQPLPDRKLVRPVNVATGEMIKAGKPLAFATGALDAAIEEAEKDGNQPVELRDSLNEARERLASIHANYAEIMAYLGDCASILYNNRAQRMWDEMSGDDEEQGD